MEGITPNATVRDRVISYYVESYWHYRTLWLNNETLSMHYGYWDEGVGTHKRSLIRMIEVMAEQTEIKPNAVVLDAGCGVGGSSIWLAKKYPVTVYGITLVEQQRNVAEENARRHGVEDRVSFQIQDYTSTSFPDASFDLIWAIESLCHAEQKSDFCREAYRLLKPGGHVVIAEYLRNEPIYQREQEKMMQGWFDSWAMPNLATWDQLQRELEEAGFDEIVHQDITRHTERSSRRIAWLTQVTAPAVMLLRALRLWSSVEQQNYEGSVLQYRLLKLGLWHYGLIRAKKK